MIRAVLLDFDGTLVTTDILTGLAELVGKRAESDALDRDFHAGKTKGRESLIQRINLLTGITVSQIEAYLNRYDFLSPGAAEFCAYLSSHGIRTILASGNILPYCVSTSRNYPLTTVSDLSPLCREIRL